MTREILTNKNRNLQNPPPQPKRPQIPPQKINQQGNILIISALIAALGISYFIYLKSKPSTNPTSTSNPPITSSPSSSVTEKESKKTYQSKNLNLTIEYAPEFEITDTGITITLKSPRGEISILRNGTQFSNLKDYLRDYDSKRKLQSIDEKSEEINGYQFLARKIKYVPENIEQKVHYIFIQNAVYILSTSSPSLYSTLDQIAQSFKYTP